MTRPRATGPERPEEVVQVSLTAGQLHALVVAFGGYRFVDAELMAALAALKAADSGDSQVT
jgi:hypothetical protein